jgi:hypothetical protein
MSSYFLKTGLKIGIVLLKIQEAIFQLITRYRIKLLSSSPSYMQTPQAGGSAFQKLSRL